MYVYMEYGIVGNRYSYLTFPLSISIIAILRNHKKKFVEKVPRGKTLYSEKR